MLTKYVQIFGIIKRYAPTCQRGAAIWRAAGAAVAMILCATHAPGATPDDRAVVNIAVLPVYAQPTSSGGAAVTSLKRGVVVTVDLRIAGPGGDWCRVMEEKATVALGFVPCAGLVRGSKAMMAVPQSTDPTIKQAAPSQSQPSTAAPTEARDVTRLLAAAKDGKRDDVELLLANGTPVHWRGDGGETALHWAAAYGHPSVAQLLIAKGADIKTQDANGATALHYAAEEGHVGVARLLLMRGADANTPNAQGMTALHLAAGNGYDAVMELLLAARADVNAQDDAGTTPLDLAAAFGRGETVKVLLRAGADVSLEDGDGHTAATIARANGHADVASMIERSRR
jgi:ankyrin repeat protein